MRAPGLPEDHTHPPFPQPSFPRMLPIPPCLLSPSIFPPHLPQALSGRQHLPYLLPTGGPALLPLTPSSGLVIFWSVPAFLPRDSSTKHFPPGREREISKTRIESRQLRLRWPGACGHFRARRLSRIGGSSKADTPIVLGYLGVMEGWRDRGRAGEREGKEDGVMEG